VRAKSFPVPIGRVASCTRASTGFLVPPKLVAVVVCKKRYRWHLLKVDVNEAIDDGAVSSIPSTHNDAEVFIPSELFQASQVMFGERRKDGKREGQKNHAPTSPSSTKSSTRSLPSLLRNSFNASLPFCAPLLVLMRATKVLGLLCCAVMAEEEEEKEFEAVVLVDLRMLGSSTIVFTGSL